MRTRIITLLMVLTVVAVSGCGRKKNKSDDGGGDNPTFKLSANDQVKFDNWKNQLVKTCDVGAIFSEGGDRQPAAPSVDGRVLLAQLNNSLAVRLDERNFVWLGTPSSLSGEATNSVDRQSQLNSNSTYNLKAKAQRKGSACEVYLFDQLAYKTDVYSGISVIAAGSGQLDPAPRPTLMSTALTVGNDPSQALLPEASAFGQQLDAGLKLTSEQQKLLAAKLGLTDEQAKSVIVDTKSRYGLGAVFSTNKPGILPSDLSYAPFVGPINDMRAIFGNSDIEMFVHFTPPTIKVGEVTNSADSGLWVMKARYTMRASDRGIDEKQVALAEVTWEAPQPFDDVRSINCMEQRLAALKVVNNIGPHSGLDHRYFPNAGAVESSCRIFAKNFAQAIIGTTEGRTAFKAIFNGVVGAPNRNYSGWDGVFREVVLAADATNRETLNQLNDGNVPLISTVSRYLDKNRTEVAKSELLKPVTTEARSMAITWTLMGLNVTDSRIENIFAAANNAIDPFVISTRRMLNSFGNDPDGHEQELQFAASLSTEYKDKARTALNKATALGVPDAIATVLSETLQKQPTLTILTGWNETLDAAQKFAERDNARIGDSLTTKSMQRDAFKKVVGIALQERWTDATFVNLENIAKYLALTMSCTNYKTASVLATRCLGSDQLENRPGKMLFVDYAGRYGNLAVEFVGYHAALDEANGTMLRNEFQRTFVAPIWKSCENQAFADKAAVLKDQVAQFAAADGLRRFDLQRAIERTLEDCR